MSIRKRGNRKRSSKQKRKTGSTTRRSRSKKKRLSESVSDERRQLAKRWDLFRRQVKSDPPLRRTRDGQTYYLIGHHFNKQKVREVRDKLSDMYPETSVRVFPKNGDYGVYVGERFLPMHMKRKMRRITKKEHDV